MWGRGGSKVWRARDRTGRLGTHFFTQNSGIVFLDNSLAKQIAEIEAKR